MARALDGLPASSAHASARGAAARSLSGTGISSTGQKVRRGEFFAGLFILGFANGIFEKIPSSIAQETFFGALSDTFGISILVWAASFLAVGLLLRLPDGPVTRSDALAGAAAAAAALLPSTYASFIALTGLGLYLRHTSAPGSPGRRAALVILALTVPLFWSRLVFALLSDPILEADAILVSALTGTARAGNTLAFAGGEGYLYIGPPCSSLANLSLAVLGWALFTQALARPPALRDYLWCALSCAAVAGINVTRIALIALYPAHFEMLHTGAGASVAGFLTLAAIIGINWIRVRGERLARP
ncbi:MAG TPA: hypothetical protein VFF88_02310 [Methylocella sp.]|nr:hypothetical protein [Methylocella sp.]